MRKSINFDLSTNALLEHFSHTSIPYSQLKNFMLENGFEHDQYSGYVSIKSINKAEISLLIEKLREELPWIKDCVLKFKVTNIGKQFDLLGELTKNDDFLEQSYNEHSQEKSKPKLRKR